ncbi:MAG TPA: hypothetical protein PKA30_13465 [Accumulibacter sp.]|uniref:ISAzo13-like element transposase-related protein n=1 Tax=Accumulibacter sp. TaxID=2053492 RepID=UPI0028792CED|nr:hypothetical protein [Accumulibacter sp.]MDS4054732.1 hypothetical protein [Accumulibacter sp.]HMV06544.1 hypothetical protein [Accumulibacter sp.]HMW64963.1 hypothetical protein [Accumulibacter sp.]HNB69313.1 hypothetical protein [Accumulibacter sp.]HNC28264.1 hypothetical protein [Accumulibacter sp.]
MLKAKPQVEFADHIGKSIRLLNYPPYHSKYNPVERCWGILEKHFERRQADRRPSDAPGGQEDDLERRSSRRQTEAHRLRKRNHRHQGRHASGRPGCKQTRSCPSAAS